LSKAKRGLGKGLNALIPEIEVAENEKALEVEIEKLRPNTGQPRKKFDQEKINELAQSIKEHGILQPLVVRPMGEEYQIVAGERRYRAAQELGLEKVPVVIKDLTDNQVLEIGLIENIQREDLNPIEEALAYQELITKFGLTQEQLAEKLGKSRSAIANALRLLNLPQEIQGELANGAITMGHARALLGIEDVKEQKKIANEIIEKDLNVRQVEDLVRRQQSKKKKTAPKQAAENIYLAEIEDQLIEALGTPVKIKEKGKSGTIEIAFYSKDDLERLVNLLL
jgi:ParB family chromosome partitioning protein